MSRKTRRDVLKGGALASLAGVLGGAGASPAFAAAGADVKPPLEGHWEVPPPQTGNNLNLIVLVSDIFRADNLEVYGSQWVETPYLNQFAKEAIVFESFYPEGMPTVPIRRQLYTGRRIFPTHSYFQQDTVQAFGWHPLYLEDVTLSETLQASGYQTALIADLYHIMKPGLNFQRGFDSFEWIRGQETDLYAQAPREIPDFGHLYPAEYFTLLEQSNSPGRRGLAFRQFLNQYTANCKRWLQHGDSIC